MILKDILYTLEISCTFATKVSLFCEEIQKREYVISA